jgi:hypothetical protein
LIFKHRHQNQSFQTKQIFLTEVASHNNTFVVNLADGSEFIIQARGIIPRANVIKLFTSLIYTLMYLAEGFVPGMPLKP